MTNQRPPHVIIISGPNGAGKSTIAPRVLRGALRVSEFVNADVIARGLSAFEPERVAISAGRIMLGRIHELADERADFAFETTLASRSFAPWVKSLVEGGYHFYLIYMWVPTPDLSIERVATRVELGGHHVPDETIRRRYFGGIRNFFDLYQPLAERWRCYDNTSRQPKLLPLEKELTMRGSTTVLPGKKSSRRTAIRNKKVRPINIDRAFAEGHAIDDAVREGVRDALLQHKNAGVPIATIVDGKVVRVHLK